MSEFKSASFTVRIDFSHTIKLTKQNVKLLEKAIKDAVKCEEFPAAKSNDVLISNAERVYVNMDYHD